MGWTIGELAQKAGVPQSTVRFYERRGLIPAPPRKAGRRDYGEPDLRRLRAIRAARAAGFNVAEIGAVAAAQNGDDARAAVRRRVAAIDADIAAFIAARTALTVALNCSCATLRDCVVFD